MDTLIGVYLSVSSWQFSFFFHFNWFFFLILWINLWGTFWKVFYFVHWASWSLCGSQRQMCESFFSEEQIRSVKGIGSRLWSRLWINAPGELSASTGGAVDVLPAAAVPLNQRESLQPSCTPTTTNYWSVTQLDEWFMAFQKAVEGFNYKQLIVSNDCSPHSNQAWIEADLCQMKEFWL